MKRISFLICLLLICMAAGATSVQAQSNKDNRSLRWERYDVTIDNVNTTANTFDVTESYRLRIIVGPYRFGTASIPMGRLTNISNFQVFENETALSVSCGGSAGTVCAKKEGDNFNVQYYFTSPAASGQTKNIRLRYTVTGALRSYTGGDQLYWVAVPADRPFNVAASQITVTFPDNLKADVATSYPKWEQTITDNKISWDSPGSIDVGDSIEVRVQYAHDPKMAPPPWQANFDRMRQIQPYVDLGLLALGVLIGLGGTIGIYVQYATHGRDAAAVVVPEYLTEPPSDELPGVVGTLVDESADMQDILATLVDLARRGCIVIEQTQTGGVMGMFQSTEFTFHRTGENESGLRDYERTLIRGMFGVGVGSGEVTMSQLRNKFYKHIPTIKQGLYKEVVGQGYFTQSPDTTRQTWAGGSIFLGIVAGGIMFWGFKAMTAFSLMAIVPFIGLIVVAVVGLIASSFMPSKTPKGSQEAVKWKAFRTYLRNIKKYTDLSQASDQFEKYIGYAVAFGINEQWTREFANVLTSMPSWYYPTYMGGRWGGGYHRGYYNQGDTFGSVGLGNVGNLGTGQGGLNDMSDSLSHGLNAMSSGLTQMLNSASSAMTSQPSSSGSGGFSGGGGSSGGGSGGGSRGFG